MTSDDFQLTPLEPPAVQKCGCGTECYWLRTRNDKWILIEAETWEPGDEIFDLRRHVAHIANCTKSQKYLQKKGRPKAANRSAAK